MGLTKPVVPVDEAPIGRATMTRIIENVPAEMVLVGGQALALWMNRYGIGPKERAGESFNTKVTTDADFLGSQEHASRLARALAARIIVPDSRALTALVAQIRVKAASGLEHNIDVLHQLYDAGGLKASVELTKRAISRAALAETESGKRIRILHPLDVLASRINNAEGLTHSKGEHVLTQARWGIKVTRVAVERVVSAGDQSTERPGAMAREIERLASSRAGRNVYRMYGIETAEAIPFALLLKKVAGFTKQGVVILRSLHKQGRMKDVRIA